MFMPRTLKITFAVSLFSEMWKTDKMYKNRCRQKTTQGVHTTGISYSFRRAGELRNVYHTCFHTHSHRVRHRRKWKYLTLGQTMRELDWTSHLSLFIFLATLSSSLWGTDGSNIDIPSRQTKEEPHEDVIRDRVSFYKLLRAAVNTQNKASILQVPWWTSKECSRFNTN